MNYENGLSASDVALLTNRNSNDGFGDGNGWWIIIFLIFAFGGFGRGFGNNSGTNSGADANYVLASDFATLQRMISDGNNMIERKLDGVTNGLCDGFYTQAQLINGVNTNVASAQYNLSNAIASDGYETRNTLTNGFFNNQTAITGVSTQIQSCCCDLKSELANINYNNAQNTCAITNAMNINTRDIIDNQNANYRALHDEIVANRMEDKNAQILAQQNEINALRLSASQSAQNEYLISALGQKTPIPSYIVDNPYCNCNRCGCGCN